MPGVVVKRTATLPDEHVQVGRPMRTTLPRALVDAAQWARGEDQARTVIAAACQQRLVTPEELTGVLDALPRVRRRQLILTTVADVAGGAQALAELDLVRLCRRFGLPEPELQEKRRDASGRTRYLDAYWRRWRLHVEVDGAHHMNAGQWERDMRRQNEVWIAGDRILRFPAWLVRRRPEEVAKVIADALRAAGWPG
jgi:very-short-patch-repair endonuclease